MRLYATKTNGTALGTLFGSSLCGAISRATTAARAQAAPDLMNSVCLKLSIWWTN